MPQFGSGVRFAQVAALPAAAANPGVVLEQGSKLWFSDGAAWVDLGAAGVGGNVNWTVVTAGQALADDTPLLAAITTAQTFTFPATLTVGHTYILRNASSSTALASADPGAGRQIQGAPVADPVTLAPGETIELVARTTTFLELLTPGAVGPAGPTPTLVNETLRALLENAALSMRNNPRTRGTMPASLAPTITVGTSTAPALHTRVYTFGAAGQPFVSCGGRPTTASGRTTFPVVTPSSTRLDFCWRVETIVDSDSVAFLLDSVTADGYRFIVDGQYVSETSTTSAAGSQRYYRLAWATKARRRVVVEGNTGLGFWGSAVPDDGQCILPPDDDSLRMFYVGDSNPFMQGFNQKGDSYGFVLGDFLGIRDTWVNPISSTGFVVAGGGNNYGGRRADWTTLPADSIDLLVFQLSYNDYNSSIPDATLQAAVATELTEARAAHPNAIIIVHGNNSWNDFAGSTAGLTAHEVAAAAAVTAFADPLVAFLPIYSATGQTLPITGQSAAGDTGTGNTPRYVSHAADHMSPAGNIYFGEWLARRFIDLLAEMAGVPTPTLAPPALDFTAQINDRVRGTVRITVGTTAPSSPAVGDIWIDTN